MLCSRRKSKGLAICTNSEEPQSKPGSCPTEYFPTRSKKQQQVVWTERKVIRRRKGPAHMEAFLFSKKQLEKTPQDLRGRNIWATCLRTTSAMTGKRWRHQQAWTLYFCLGDRNIWMFLLHWLPFNSCDLMKTLSIGRKGGLGEKLSATKDTQNSFEQTQPANVSKSPEQWRQR